ncbi:MAG: hypothetical protein L0211_14280 [Planctomycetaceae bacterium]|nr:hypothetical protein [Planctomycetaceae bacterium]
MTQVKVEKVLARLPRDEINAPRVLTASKPGPWASLAGSWKIAYANGAVRRYTIEEEGSVVFVEEQRRGTLAKRDRDVVLDFGDGKLERLGLVNETLLIEHFNPATSYPAGEPLRARGVKEEAVRLDSAGLAPEAGGLLKLFEDEPAFIDQLKEGRGEVFLEERDVYHGKGAVKVTRDQRFVSFLPEFKVRIREAPGPGEYRYLRFAWKKTGGTEIGIQLHTIENEGAKIPGAIWIRYHIGPQATFLDDRSIRIGTALPSDWAVVTRDLYADYGELTITGIALTPHDDHNGLFDHIYFARDPRDFDRLKQQYPRRGAPQR